jgi:hypothetical protein
VHASHLPAAILQGSSATLHSHNYVCLGEDSTEDVTMGISSQHTSHAIKEATASTATQSIASCHDTLWLLVTAVHASHLATAILQGSNEYGVSDYQTVHAAAVLRMPALTQKQQPRAVVSECADGTP